ncbi:MAG: hypothetical protein V1860_02765 [bacterium]
MLLGFLIFYFFFHTKTATEITTSPAGTGQQTQTLPGAGQSQLPMPEGAEKIIPETNTTLQNIYSPSPAANGGITKTATLYDNPIYGVTAAPNNGGVISYDKTEGKFIRISPDGKINYMSSKIFYDVEKITWSPNKMEAVLEYPDGSNIVYNFKTQKQVTLPQHWQEFSYSPQGNEIAAKSLSSNTDNNWLIISDPAGDSIIPVEQLGTNGDKVYNNWSPNNKVIAMYAESSDFDRQNLYFIGQNHENFPLTIIEGRGFEGLWSKKGDKLLYSVYNSASSFKPLLWTVTADGEDMSKYRRKIDVNTWADKCSFYDNENIYCAVPESLPDASGIYPEIADDIPDNIYKINITTGEKKFIARPAENATIDTLFISDDGQYLYYTDKNTGLLKKMALK